MNIADVVRRIITSPPLRNVVPLTAAERYSAFVAEREAVAARRSAAKRVVTTRGVSRTSPAFNRYVEDELTRRPVPNRSARRAVRSREQVLRSSSRVRALEPVGHVRDDDHDARDYGTSDAPMTKAQWALLERTARADGVGR